MHDFDYLINTYIKYGKLDNIIEHQKNQFEPKIDTKHLISAIKYQQKHIINYLLDFGLDVNYEFLNDSEKKYLNMIKKERLIKK
jgi:hypothetical protein